MKSLEETLQAQTTAALKAIKSKKAEGRFWIGRNGDKRVLLVSLARKDPQGAVVLTKAQKVRALKKGAWASTRGVLLWSQKGRRFHFKASKSLPQVAAMLKTFDKTLGVTGLRVAIFEVEGANERPPAPPPAPDSDGVVDLLDQLDIDFGDEPSSDDDDPDDGVAFEPLDVDGILEDIAISPLALLDASLDDDDALDTLEDDLDTVSQDELAALERAGILALVAEGAHRSRTAFFGELGRGLSRELSEADQDWLFETYEGSSEKALTALLHPDINEDPDSLRENIKVTEALEEMLELEHTHHPEHGFNRRAVNLISALDGDTALIDRLRTAFRGNSELLEDVFRSTTVGKSLPVLLEKLSEAEDSGHRLANAILLAEQFDTPLDLTARRVTLIERDMRDDLRDASPLFYSMLGDVYVSLSISLTRSLRAFLDSNPLILQGISDFARAVYEADLDRAVELSAEVQGAVTRGEDALAEEHLTALHRHLSHVEAHLNRRVSEEINRLMKVEKMVWDFRLELAGSMAFTFAGAVVTTTFSALTAATAAVTGPVGIAGAAYGLWQSCKMVVELARKAEILASDSTAARERCRKAMALIQSQVETIDPHAPEVDGSWSLGREGAGLLMETLIGTQISGFAQTLDGVNEELDVYRFKLLEVEAAQQLLAREIPSVLERGEVLTREWLKLKDSGELSAASRVVEIEALLGDMSGVLDDIATSMQGLREQLIWISKSRELVELLQERDETRYSRMALAVKVVNIAAGLALPVHGIVVSAHHAAYLTGRMLGRTAGDLTMDTAAEETMGSAVESMVIE